MLNSADDTFFSLLQKDQTAIVAFRGGKISQAEWLKASLEISKDFLGILGKIGFPYKDASTEDEYRAAITLLLHLDLSGMREVFNTYIDKQSSGRIVPEHWAMCVDKIRVISGRPQLYGTQYKIDKNKKIDLLPLENAGEVDEIRNKAGLQPLKQYLDSIAS